MSNCSWSPNGTQFVCLSRTGPSDTLNTGPERSDVRHYTSISYKFNDTGWYDDKRSHSLGHRRRVRRRTSDHQRRRRGTTPTRSGRPTARRIAFVSDRTGKELDEGRNTDIWTVPANGGSLTKISTSPDRDASPVWSPDGKTIAFVSAEDEDAPQQL